MKYSVLYYPNFEPNQRWLRSILLFVDNVQRIVPEAANHVDSVKMQRLLKVMPDVLTTVPLNEGDKQLDSVNFERLEKAFAMLQKQVTRSRKLRLVLEVDTKGQVSALGNVWLSRSKVTERIEHLLGKYDLAHADLFGEVNPLDGSDMFPVNATAANLIVSYVADRIAVRTGLDTVTDAWIPHTIHSLDALQVSPPSLQREGHGLLTAAIANLAVPDGIERMDVFEYQELRESFEEIRAPFHKLVNVLSQNSKIYRQQSAAGLEMRIQEAIADFKKYAERHKKYAVTKKINKWTPIFFQGILSLLIPFSSEMAQFIEASGFFGIEVMKNLPSADTPKIEHEETLRMLCRLDRRVNQKLAIKRLA